MALCTDEQITQALVSCHGLVTPAAAVLGINRSTLYKRLKPDHIKLIADLREAITDAAERNMFTAIQRGDPRATEFWLKYQGKARGYTDRQEVKLEGQISTEDAAKKRQSITGLVASLRSAASRSNGSL